MVAGSIFDWFSFAARIARRVVSARIAPSRRAWRDDQPDRSKSSTRRLATISDMIFGVVEAVTTLKGRRECERVGEVGRIVAAL